MRRPDGRSHKEALLALTLVLAALAATMATSPPAAGLLLALMAGPAYFWTGRAARKPSRG
jgi:hypothetical protein